MRLRTGQVAEAAGCSGQLVRDLEAAGVIPSAVRDPNGYRRFGAVHVAAVRAYRLLSPAVGPTAAREVMRSLAMVEADVALAHLSGLHLDLGRRRDQALQALRALQMIRTEGDDAPGGMATMTITELAGALDVRSSTLRFWEQEGLLTPERVGRLGARSYPDAVVREARIVAALREAGYPIPAVADVMSALRASGSPDALRQILQARLDEIARCMSLLLRAGAELVELLPALRGDYSPAATSTA